MHGVKLVARSALIAFVLLRHFVWWFVGWLGRLITLRGKAARQKWFADQLAATFRALGATYVKVGQIMSTRPDLLPPHIIAGLSSLQDDVGAFPARFVDETLVKEFGGTADTLFAEFDRQPIASASVAQVHRGKLEDGTVVAVKIRRPKIVDVVEFDLAVIRFGARIMSLIPSIGLLAPVESVEQFGDSIREQMDLAREADNNRRFRELFAGWDDVTFPRVIPELSSSRVLTMTFIEGDKILRHGGTQGDRTRLAKIGFQIMLKMVFEDGFVHADLHPGNIFVTPEGQVALLDLGLTATLDDTHRNVFAQFFAAWATRDAKTMARLMTEFSPSSKVKNYDQFETEVLGFVDRYRDKKLGEVLVSKVAFDMMSILRRHRVRANPTFTMVNIAIAVTEGIGRQLDPSLDLLGEAMPFFARMTAAKAAAGPVRSESM